MAQWQRRDAGAAALVSRRLLSSRKGRRSPILLFVLLSDSCKLVGNDCYNTAGVVVIVFVGLFRLGGMSVEVNKLAEFADISFVPRRASWVG